MEQKNGVAATTQDVLTHHLNSFGEEVDGDTTYIVWKAETADNRFELGTDTFIVQNGKIVTQTFAGKISPKR
jgi:hypothetical protein